MGNNIEREKERDRERDREYCFATEYLLLVIAVRKGPGYLILLVPPGLDASFY